MIKKKVYKPLSFPTDFDRAQTFTLFSTITNNTKYQKTNTEYVYQSRHVLSFRDIKCQTNQPNGLCRRVNLAPTYMSIQISNQYTMFVAGSILFSMMGSIIHFLRMATKIVSFIRSSKYCNNKQSRRDSMVEFNSLTNDGEEDSPYLQVQ